MRVDFMLVADYVRAEVGVLHMVAGGFDKIQAAAVPSARNVGIGLRIMLTRAECDYEHSVQFAFRRAGRTEPVALYSGVVRAQWPEGVELAGDGGEVAVTFALNVGIPLPEYGQYTLHLIFDDVGEKEIPIVVVPLEAGGRPAEA